MGLGFKGSLAMCQRLSTKVCQGGCVCIGMYVLKNLWLLVVILPESGQQVNINNSGLFPFDGVWASLILNPHMVTNHQLHTYMYLCSFHMAVSSSLVARVSLHMGCGL